MDTTAKEISFDVNGYCNFCTDFESTLAIQTSSKESREKDLVELIATMKRQGEGREYDCIVGVSGGVDSSYVLYLTVELGLRPLAVHLDNGWNSELATANIARLVSSLDVDLHTHVIEWEENKNLQLAFIKADVVDIELLMDNAMLSLNYQQAKEHGLQFILSGENLTTEGLRMPEGWYHYKFDARNIKRIQKKFGDMELDSHPITSTLGFIYYEYVRRIRKVPFLNFFEYNKEEATEILKSACGYRPYEYKHYESVFTRFYQAVILPLKFGIDKRRVHLSSLIMTRQMDRENALNLLTEPPYSDRDQERTDQYFVIKKLGMSNEEFAEYLVRPAVEHSQYGSELGFERFLLSMYKIVRKIVRFRL
jgi:N-acetyl sugar amidotransferase